MSLVWKKRLQDLISILVLLWVMIVVVGEIVQLVFRGSFWLSAVAVTLGFVGGYALNCLVEHWRTFKKGAAR